MKYTKGDRVQLRDSAIAAIVSAYESTRGYAVVVDGETTHLYRHEDQIRGRLDNDVHCRCGHEHAGMCTRCDCVKPHPERMGAWMFVVFLVSLAAAALTGTASD
jgi:hypothetical protein